MRCSLKLLWKGVTIKEVNNDLDKAIETLSASAYWGMTTLDQNFKDACKLGIEALMIIQKERRDLLSYAGELLPGETE